jgi:DNA-binding IclR family transcriptional regulator
MTNDETHLPKRRLGRRQLQKLELMALYTSFTPMTAFRTLLSLGALGLAEMKPKQPRWWRIGRRCATHARRHLQQVQA